MWKTQLFELDYCSREKEAALGVLDRRWLTMGEEVEKFESEFSDFIGDGVESIAVSSCTAALHLSLLALGVGAGDEVIIPSLTFVAAANVVLAVGATPVFADCRSLLDWNVSTESISAKVTNNTKAIMVVHFAGYPCAIDKIAQFAKEKKIFLIEDVAHAPGASIAGQMCGSWGDVGCFSFFSNKNIAVGEGGMITTADRDLGSRLRYLRSHGMTTLTVDRHKGRASSYDVAMPGLNYRIDEVRAAVGRVQLSKVAEGNEKRRELVLAYQQALRGTDVICPFEETRGSSAYHIQVVLLPKEVNRQQTMEHMKAEGIQTSIHYPSFRDFSAYRGLVTDNDTPICDEITRRVLTLPLHPNLAKEQIISVCHTLLRLMQ